MLHRERQLKKSIEGGEFALAKLENVKKLEEIGARPGFDDCKHCDCWLDHRATCCDCGISE